ncbi:uncharacterized protein RJT20DRAFT_47047 [Scheffersomyces xylosifermentans]|uniref:uncharacterized protein n=1 Tax=Scheffersomyces xylosifermentans TaxID=1304137 RepID=UPI00315D2DD3
MSNVQQIPGYYYDPEKRRYFKIINGGLNQPEQVQKYHNNSVEKEKRRSEYRESREGSSSSSGSGNSKNKKRAKKSAEDNSEWSQLIQQHSKQWVISQLKDSFTMDNKGINAIKTGAIDLNNRYFLSDHVDALENRVLITPVQYQDNMTPSGIAECQIDEETVLVRCIDEELHRFLVFNLEEKRAHFLDNTAIKEYLDENQCMIGEEKFYENASGYRDHFELLRVIEIDDPLNYLFRFEIVRSSGKYVDNTRQLLHFVSKRIEKLNKTAARNLEIVFGLPLVKFHNNESMSTEEMNEVLRSDLEPEKKDAMLSEYLYRHDKYYRSFYYGTYKNASLNYIIQCEVTDHKEIIVLSDIYLVRIEYKLKEDMSAEFISFSFADHSKIFRGESKLLCAKESIHILTPLGIFVFNHNDLATSGSGEGVKYRHISRAYLPNGSIHKCFMLTPTKYIIGTTQRAIIYDDELRSKTVVDTYFNDNNPHQIFLLIGDHLIINESEDEFKIINLNRKERHKSTTVKLDLHFMQAGWFMNFKLKKVISMSTNNGRIKLGLTYLNEEDDRYSIFETHSL